MLAIDQVSRLSIEEHRVDSSFFTYMSILSMGFAACGELCAGVYLNLCEDSSLFKKGFVPAFLHLIDSNSDRIEQGAHSIILLAPKQGVNDLFEGYKARVFSLDILKKLGHTSILIDPLLNLICSTDSVPTKLQTYIEKHDLDQINIVKLQDKYHGSRLESYICRLRDFSKEVAAMAGALYKADIRKVQSMVPRVEAQAPYVFVPALYEQTGQANVLGTCLDCCFFSSKKPLSRELADSIEKGVATMKSKFKVG